LLFVGAVGKSAQLGLHTWLPDAMEGPTPVSALIHAATMVTAGVFLLARCSIILEYAPYALNIIAFFGAMTAFFAASVGLVQNDLKRVIAYSTCSQLGYMIFACGLSNFNVAVFHLANHAFFKALLFLGAGSIIHAVADEQDMRKTGGLRKLLPFTYGMMMIGSLSLMGFPFLTGFYSKDVILEVAYAGFSIPGHFAYWLGTVGAFFTAFYSIRLIYLTFLIDSSAHRKTIVGVHESPWKMTIPLFILSIPSIFIGYYSKDMMIGFGSLFWGNAITIHPSHFTLVDSEFIPTLFKLLPVTLSCIGAGLSFFLYNSNYRVLYLIKISLFGKKIYKFLNRKWYFDKVYNECINQNLLTFSYNTTFKSIDRGILELMGPMGVSIVTQKTSELLQKAQNGNFFDYSTWFLGSITLIVTVWSYLNWEISYSLLMLDTLDHRCVLFLLFFFVIFDQGKKNK
jgi:NADH-ubiquinone oxidoreductase chain 5